MTNGQQNTHLESTADHTEERVRQLRCAYITNSLMRLDTIEVLLICSLFYVTKNLLQGGSRSARGDNCHPRGRYELESKTFRF